MEKFLPFGAIAVVFAIIAVAGWAKALLHKKGPPPQ